jgi:hypothetical protein
MRYLMYRQQDFSHRFLVETLLSVWTKTMKVDTVLDAFGNAPTVLLNAAFELRNPIENIHKY